MAPNKDSAKNESVQVTITYRNGENRTWLKSNETLTAINMYNYTMKNAIKFQTHGASEKTFNDALVYTDGKYCNIFYTTNGSSNGKQKGGTYFDHVVFNVEILAAFPLTCSFGSVTSCHRQVN
ncbi:hypothetical protein MTO96_007785 [Rhipicephalus appendiculatus]